MDTDARYPTVYLDVKLSYARVALNGSAPQGKQRLIDAALRLAARGTSLSSLGLRELAREAGLNHNTFYRHFDDVADLSVVAAEEVATQLMAGMKEARRNAVKHADANRGAAEYFLDYVRRNPDPFIVGVREANTAFTPMRAVIQRVLEQISIESVEQIRDMNLAPGLDRQALLRATAAIAHYMFYRALDFIEHPEQRDAIADDLVTFMNMQFLGAAALSAR